MAAQFYEYTKTTDVYILNAWIVWYVNDISIKLLLKKKFSGSQGEDPSSRPAGVELQGCEARALVDTLPPRSSRGYHGNSRMKVT